MSEKQNNDKSFEQKNQQKRRDNPANDSVPTISYREIRAKSESERKKKLKVVRRRLKRLRMINAIRHKILINSIKLLVKYIKIILSKHNKLSQNSLWIVTLSKNQIRIKMLLRMSIIHQMVKVEKIQRLKIKLI